MNYHLPDEIEAKFYPVDVGALRKSLRDMGAECISPMRLMKRAVFDARDNPQLPIAYIRVRDEGDKITFSAKDCADEKKGHLHQRELVVSVSDFDNTVSLLKLIGLKQTNYQESKRETWKIGQAEICIDIWPGLEAYIEIETTSLDEINRVANKLPLSGARRYEGGLLPVYMDVYGWDKSTALQNVSRMTFEHVDFEVIK